jgi:hypothetical protein
MYCEGLTVTSEQTLRLSDGPSDAMIVASSTLASWEWELPMLEPFIIRKIKEEEERRRRERNRPQVPLYYEPPPPRMPPPQREPDDEESGGTVIEIDL